MLDIGAGYGALTTPLVATGARVIAFELHPRRAHALRELFAGTSVKVVRADASDLRLPRRPFHVVANPPFGITAALVRRLTCRSSALASAHLVVPRHAAMRWAGRAGDFDIAVGHPLPPAAFRPAATQRTVVLRITGPCIT